MQLVVIFFDLKISLIYLDDVIVYGGNCYGTLDRLKLVWQCIREAQLKLKLGRHLQMSQTMPA